METIKKKKKYWYRFTWGSCPQCGRDKSYKERIYGRKPKSLKKRHLHMSDYQAYDYCIG
jgi:hypothetical protein